MPEMDGIETSEYITKHYPDAKIVILTMMDDNKFILHLMEVGVHGYLLKDTDPEELENAILGVYDNDFYYNKLVFNVMKEGFYEIKQRVP